MYFFPSQGFSGSAWLSLNSLLDQVSIELRGPFASASWVKSLLVFKSWTTTSLYILSSKLNYISKTSNVDRILQLSFDLSELYLCYSKILALMFTQTHIPAHTCSRFIDRTLIFSSAGRVSFPSFLPLGGKQLQLWLHFFCNLPVFPLGISVFIIIRHPTLSAFFLLSSIFCLTLSVSLSMATYHFKTWFLSKSTLLWLRIIYDVEEIQSNRIDVINYILDDLFRRL